MKKKFMAIFALLLAVVVTGYSVSGTYAKYTTTMESSDKARVAVWKVGTAFTIDLFDNTYDNGAVKSKGEETDKVVAPGTTGSYAFAITGGDELKPEVAYKLDVTVDQEKTKDDTERLRFWLDADSYDGASDKYASISELKSNLGNDLSVEKVEVGKNLNDALSNHTLHWEWQFSEAEKDTTDTGLGNAADGSTTAVEIGIKITATQLDTVE